MVELEEKRYPYKIVERLIRDDRLRYVDGRIVPYIRYTYENGKEIKQYGYNFSYTKNSHNLFNSYTNGIIFWINDDCNLIRVVEHVGNPEIVEFDKGETDKIINHIVNIILKKKSKIIKEMVI